MGFSGGVRSPEKSSGSVEVNPRQHLPKHLNINKHHGYRWGFRGNLKVSDRRISGQSQMIERTEEPDPVLGRHQTLLWSPTGKARGT